MCRDVRIVGVCVIAACCAAGALEDRLRLAVTNLDPHGIDAAAAVLITDRLRSELFATGKYTVVERSQMETILKEQGFQQSGCTSDECAVEVGQLLGVQYMVVGSIGKVGRTYTINARVINVATAEIEASTNVDCQCDIDEVLTRSTKEVAVKVAGGLSKRGQQATLSELKGQPAVPAIKPAAELSGQEATAQARKALVRGESKRTRTRRTVLQVAGGAFAVGGAVLGLVMNAKAQDDIDRATAIATNASALTFEQDNANYLAAKDDYETHSAARTVSYLVACLGVVAFAVSFAF